jgi:hypothetical protein
VYYSKGSYFPTTKNRRETRPFPPTTPKTQNPSLIRVPLEQLLGSLASKLLGAFLNMLLGAFLSILLRAFLTVFRGLFVLLTGLSWAYVHKLNSLSIPLIPIPVNSMNLLGFLYISQQLQPPLSRVVYLRTLLCIYTSVNSHQLLNGLLLAHSCGLIPQWAPLLWILWTVLCSHVYGLNPITHFLERT